jgi:acyl-CoA dehydrogenase
VDFLNQFYGGFLGESTGFFVLSTVLVLTVLGFTGGPLAAWTSVAAIVLIGFGAPAWLLAIAAVIALVFNVKPLRRALVSSGVLKAMKALKIVPAISDTERVALEAGMVWAEGELFSGKPDFKKLMAEPYPQLTAEEKAFINGPVERLCEMIDEWDVWQKRDMPPHVWDFIKKEKFLGMIIPKEYGGLGFSALAHSEVIMKLSTRSVPACISVMVPNSLGPAELLNHYGTDAQKKYYLPRLAVGEEMPCFALTEPTAGSDAGSLTASGVLFKGDDGKLYVRLNWNKRWITLAAISTLVGLAFRLRDPDNLLGKGEDVGITCALIPAKTPGVVLGRRHDPMGIPFYNCPTQGKDVVVSVDQIIGGIEGAGNGWKMLMESLAAGRGISLPAQSVGGAKLATMVTSAHASVRKQFGLPIGKFEGIEEPLARIAGSTYLMEAFRRYVLGGLDKGIKPPVVTAMAKYHQTELGRKVINDAMDIVAGQAISRGPRNLLANVYVSSPIGITVEGANILTRTLIIFGQGALRAHPFAFKEVDAIAKGDLTAFDSAFWGHIGHVVRNAFRSVVLSLTHGFFVPTPVGGSVAKYYRRLAWASASFAIMADIAMGSLGGSLKMREKITGRFADILSWMFINTSVLRRWIAEGERKEDLPFVHFALGHGFYEIQKAFDGIFTNLEVPGLTWLFRGPIRWWSNLNSIGGESSDKHTHKIASLILMDSEQRARLTEGVYVPKDPNQALGRYEEAFRLVKRAENAEKKIRKAISDGILPKTKGAAAVKAAFDKHIISNEEMIDLQRAEEVRYNAIQVDDFSQEEYLQHSSVTTTRVVPPAGATAVGHDDGGGSVRASRTHA